ncbi:MULTISPECIES: GntR family transcriptional regulator [unclassified Minwuia]|jgi:DNA-binding GntR family transcriptional regulator|uniref:GntR family transcriptional regulator n=1 Tax=unclassified Minwuia TaxID=2618799 RepID=UPI00247B140E|nr:MULTISPECIES: GntR family transcriptional regulator [unclassified Minwuia]
MSEAGTLAEQVYNEILDEICAGTFPAEARLKQESLALQLGVSRQPVQQALSQLKADGIVQDAPGRGLAVATPDLIMVRHRYQVRLILDCLASEMAAKRCAEDSALARNTRQAGARILDQAMAALDANDLKALFNADVAFHALVYDTTGNPALKDSATVHWRYLQRIMSCTLREVEDIPDKFWNQHKNILDAIVDGRVRRANRWARIHIRYFLAIAERVYGDTSERQLEH